MTLNPKRGRADLERAFIDVSVLLTKVRSARADATGPRKTILRRITNQLDKALDHLEQTDAEFLNLMENFDHDKTL